MEVARSLADGSSRQPSAEPSNKSLLDDAKAALQKSDFATAKTLLQTLHDRLPNDHHVLHQLALATSKDKRPDIRSALAAASDLLRTVSPATTNDPETLGLWGAVHKRLWDLDQDPKALDASISAYSRGFPA